MEIEEMLSTEEEAIVADVCRSLSTVEHYRRDSEQATRKRVEALYRQVKDAIGARTLSELREFSGQIARERLQAGFEFAEVHAAFSALEKAIWHHALVALPTYDQVLCLGLASTAIAHGDAAMGRVFGEGDGAAKPPIDLTPLFNE
jgi:hypothetical protein